MKRYILTAMLFIFLLAGCITDSNDSDDSAIGSGLYATDYIPLVPGMIYTYTTTQTFKPASSEHTATVSKPLERNGNIYYAVVGQPLALLYDIISDSTYVRIADNTMYVSNKYDDTDIPYIDFDAASWDVSHTQTNGMLYSGYEESIWTGKYLRRETVTVPAGTFEQCPVFEIAKRRNITVTGSDPHTEMDMETLMVWIAEGVGWVKYVADWDFLYNGSPLVDSSFTDTMELISYTMP